SEGNGIAGLEKALTRGYDLVVLDVNLPGCDGFEILRRIRAADVPSRVLMLTARADVADRVTGLKSGADDYVPKPFSMDEFLARVEVLGRRGGSGATEDVLRHGPVCMELGKRRVTLKGEPAALSPREFDVLRIFMQEPGRVFSRDEICERIWNREHEYDTRTVEIFIMRLRRKLSEGETVPLIETVRGIGYRLRRA
ncbi:MAG: two component transcriptional regulator, winged helix family, partial [Verrucomicrobiales bacterium]|nr:two component transcriptional regulator, winged helix family [Verrucomicrobiales bacterium]